MAWITVHDELIGGKLRKLQREVGCSQNEAIGIIVKLWLWAIERADEHGVIGDADREDVETAIAKEIGRNLYPDEVMDALVSTGWIKFTDDVVVLLDWEESQAEWYKIKHRRERDNERQRQFRAKQRTQKTDNPPQEATVGQITIPVENPINPPQIAQKRPKIDYSNEFKQFWEVYPRTQDKGAAYKCYNARLKDGWSPEELLQAATGYAEACRRNKTEKQYIKHAKTFLSASTPFVDYLPKNEDSGEAKTADSNANPFSMFRR